MVSFQECICYTTSNGRSRVTLLDSLRFCYRNAKSKKLQVILTCIVKQEAASAERALGLSEPHAVLPHQRRLLVSQTLRDKYNPLLSIAV